MAPATLRTDLAEARSWEEWRDAADACDRASGAADWRDDPESPYYDHVRLAADLERLRQLRTRPDGLALADALAQSVYRHQADLAAPELYDVALGGTKRLVGAWLDEVEACLRWLAANPVQGMGPTEKRRAFERAWHVYGRSALLLSGGATWGFHHLGVVKALHDRGVLPHVLSGASTGAMIAAGICARDDDGIRALFADTDQIRRDGLLRLGLGESVRRGGLLDPAQLEQVLRHNVGDVTFAEAYARSGRALNISVSPTRPRQKPRVLSHLTTPDVLVVSAALASSALPGLFPPVGLRARGPDGRTIAYLPEEEWVDGSIAGDIPKLRLARLFNVNHFIVSQTNPHVAPVLGLTGVAPAVAGAATVTARSQTALVTDIVRRAAPRWLGPAQLLADRAYHLVSQDYTGDIDIHPRFRRELLTRMVSNPSREDLATFILEGERATWPRIPRITDETRIGRVFAECVRMLRGVSPGDAGYREE